MLLCHSLRFGTAVGLSIVLLLSACGGGGGGGVASLPPPPTPTPTPSPEGPLQVRLSWLPSPATQAGSYGVIGRLTLTPGNGNPTSYRAAKPGEFAVNATSENNAPFLYTLNASSGVLPGGLTSIANSGDAVTWTFNGDSAFHEHDLGGDFPQWFGQRLSASRTAPDGTETQILSNDFTHGSTTTSVTLGANTRLQTTLNYDTGYSYVAMGEWSWRVVDLAGEPAGDFGDLLFVNGDRTPASGIPASGTATYDARSLVLPSSSGIGIPFSLTADFGQRVISTRIDQDYVYYNAYDSPDGPIQGIHVAGSSPFNNDGSFGIPLSGTVNFSVVNQPTTPSPEPVTGSMDGAFFGPHAEQVGGVFAVGRSDGTLLMQDAFVGQAHH